VPHSPESDALSRRIRGCNTRIIHVSKSAGDAGIPPPPPLSLSLSLSLYRSMLFSWSGARLHGYASRAADLLAVRRADKLWPRIPLMCPIICSLLSVPVRAQRTANGTEHTLKPGKVISPDNSFDLTRKRVDGSRPARICSFLTFDVRALAVSDNSTLYALRFASR
jgi:hypothetical protein